MLCNVLIYWKDLYHLQTILIQLYVRPTNLTYRLKLAYHLHHHFHFWISSNSFIYIISQLNCIVSKSREQVFFYMKKKHISFITNMTRSYYPRGHGHLHLNHPWSSILYAWFVWYMLSGREDTYFYAPLEKGGILLCNYRSVGRSVSMSVCWFVDQVLSGQYLLTPSFDQYQTWCKGCPQWVDDPYWSLGHIITGQGQPTLLRPVCCLVNICWLLHLINTKLGAGVALNGYMIPIDFEVTYSKVKIKPLFSAHCVVRSISFEPFTWSIPNLVFGVALNE